MARGPRPDTAEPLELVESSFLGERAERLRIELPLERSASDAVHPKELLLAHAGEALHREELLRRRRREEGPSEPGHHRAGGLAHLATNRRGDRHRRPLREHSPHRGLVRRREDDRSKAGTPAKLRRDHRIARAERGERRRVVIEREDAAELGRDRLGLGVDPHDAALDARSGDGRLEPAVG